MKSFSDPDQMKESEEEEKVEEIVVDGQEKESSLHADDEVDVGAEYD